MKATRSVTSRHFFGGFVGGILGILAFHFVAAVALPVGCFAGVVLGFWYQELGIAVAKEWREFCASTEKSASEPVHPIDTAKWIQMWATICGVGVCIIASVCALPALYALGMFEDALIIFPCAFLLGGAFLGWAGCVAEQSFDETIPGIYNMNRYYKLLALYTNRGGTYLFARGFTLALLAPFAMFLIFMMAIAALVLCVVTAVPVCATVSLVFATMRQVYKIAMGPGHWLCVGVTVAVTGATAYLMNDSMTDSGVWLAALVAGTLSGAASVYAHRGLGWVLERSPRAAHFMAKTVDQHWGGIKQAFVFAARWIFTPSGYQYRLHPTRI